MIFDGTDTIDVAKNLSDFYAGGDGYGVFTYDFWINFQKYFMSVIIFGLGVFPSNRVIFRIGIIWKIIIQIPLCGTSSTNRKSVSLLLFYSNT